MGFDRNFVRSAGAGLCALAAALGPAPLAAQEPRFGIHGSNTIGAELMPALIEAYARGANLTIERTDISADGLSETMTTYVAGAAVFTIDLQRFGSGTSYPGLSSGEAEIGMSSRPAKDKEVAAVLEATGVDIRQPGAEHVLALDGIAVIVNPENPLQALTQEDVARIFAGEIENWAGLGLRPGPIRLHARDANSGTFDTFDALALSPFDREISPTALRYAANEAIASEVAADPLAIGFVPLAAVLGVKPVAIAQPCGIITSPTPFSVKAEEYPLGRRLYLYTAGAPETTAADLLLRFG
ncbi:MAG: substrate-binding domain-containing protein, partial [Pseudomonadota bacterium]